MANDSSSNSSEDGTSRHSGRESSSGDSYNSSNRHSIEAIARQHSKAVVALKYSVLILLVSMAASVSYAFYTITSNEEDNHYEDEFADFADKLIDGFYDEWRLKIATITTLSSGIISHFDMAGANFPYVTIPDFERRCSGPRRIAKVPIVTFAPFVSIAERPAWEEYAQENWRQTRTGFADPYTGLNHHLEETAESDYNNTSTFHATEWRAEDGIFRIENEVAFPDEEVAVLAAPIWQAVPYLETDGAVMFNQMSEAARARGIQSMLVAKEHALSIILHEETHDSIHHHYHTPRSVLYYPVFESLAKENMVGALAFELEWETFFADKIETVEKPMHVVLDSILCGQLFTFEVVGPKATFMGKGDLHDNSFKGPSQSSTVDGFDNAFFGHTHQEGSKTEDNCHYVIHVYPSGEFDDAHKTHKPKLYTAGITLIFVISGAVFIFYDCLVERRQERVLKTAKRSNAIVKSIFPAGVRTRLLHSGPVAGVPQPFPGGAPTETMETLAFPVQTPKYRIKSYLDQAPTPGYGKNRVNNTGEPIADFFPHTTVLFAKIAGFSGWSSERDPGQVFALLEAVYRAMDKTARRYGVFKVETVADQYVAATGLPDPRDDHAVVMARFARATLVEVDELTMSLEASLGPGTGELCMRFGIHSGPITAGVLRSEKARFQLFGDTMNTSARMESTGENNKIQVTKEFVDELSKAGKLHWYSPRDELVTAKGKGQLQTYWLTLSSTSRSVMSGVSDTGEKEVTPPDGLVVLHDAEKGMTHSTSSNSVLTDDTDASKNSKKSVDYKVWCGKDSTIDFSTPLQLENNLVRLVDWNSEVLFVLLSKVCAHRKLVKKKTRPNFQYNKPSGDTIALDEVKEVVMLPEFDADAASKMATMDANVKLGPEVKSELRDFVGRVASSYQGNPFHNFEHASHVLLSASKLLTRILQPDAVVCKKSSDGHKDDKGKVVADALHQHTYGLSSDPLTQFAVVFSALIHDAGHTGVSNFQLAKEDPEVAIKYRNKSLAEQKSIDICWNILMAPCYDNLRRCIFVSTEERTLFRQLLVNSVMATDIFDKELGAIRTARWEKAFHSEEASVVGLDQSSEALSRKATIVIEHIIQASDVAHTMQHWSIYCKWNERLFQEQYNNFRSGRSDTDPSEKWFKGEIWFFDNYVIPLARKLEECGVFGVSSDEYLKYALENRAEWERNGGSITEKIMLKAQLLWQRDNNES